MSVVQMGVNMYVSDQTIEQMVPIILYDFRNGQTEVNVIKGNECLTIRAQCYGPVMKEYFTCEEEGLLHMPFSRFRELLYRELTILYRDNPDA